MRKSRRQKVLRTAEPHIQPGEQAEVIAMAKVGSFPVKKNLAAGVAAAAIGAAFGGTAIMAFAQSETYMLLTDRQLLFFAANRQTGAPGKHRASVPREAVKPTVVKDGLFLSILLNIEGADKEIRLKFAPLPPSGRKLGRQLVASLQSGAPAVQL